jgi:hypothetical protein
MRNLLAAAALLALAAPLARADAPPLPEGTEPLKLFEGDAKEIPGMPGSQVVCDDPTVARGDVANDKFVLVAVHPGQTLCAVRYNGANRGIYQVTVRPAEKK